MPLEDKDKSNLSDLDRRILDHLVSAEGYADDHVETLSNLVTGRNSIDDVKAVRAALESLRENGWVVIGGQVPERPIWFARPAP